MASFQPDKKVHSIKVPRLYKVAAGVLKDFKNGSFSNSVPFKSVLSLKQLLSVQLMLNFISFSPK
jgi:hypothetical protein